MDSFSPEFLDAERGHFIGGIWVTHGENGPAHGLIEVRIPTGRDAQNRKSRASLAAEIPLPSTGMSKFRHSGGSVATLSQPGRVSDGSRLLISTGQDRFESAQ